MTAAYNYIATPKVVFSQSAGAFCGRSLLGSASRPTQLVAVTAMIPAIMAMARTMKNFDFIANLEDKERLHINGLNYQSDQQNCGCGCNQDGKEFFLHSGKA